jgi:hypothetical protein
MSVHSSKYKIHEVSLNSVRIQVEGRDLNIPWARATDELKFQGAIQVEAKQCFGKGLVQAVPADVREVKISFRFGVPFGFAQDLKIFGLARRIPNSPFAVRLTLADDSPLHLGIGAVRGRIFLVKKFIDSKDYFSITRMRTVSIWEVFGRGIPLEKEVMEQILKEASLEIQETKIIGRHWQFKINPFKDNDFLQFVEQRGWKAVRPGHCFRCGCAGHISAECSQGIKVITCVTCGKPGHKAGSSLCRGKVKVLSNEEIGQVLGLVSKELTADNPRPAVVAAFRYLEAAVKGKTYADAAHGAIKSNNLKQQGEMNSNVKQIRPLDKSPEKKKIGIARKEEGIGKPKPVPSAVDQLRLFPKVTMTVKEPVQAKEKTIIGNKEAHAGQEKTENVKTGETDESVTSRRDLGGVVENLRKASPQEADMQVTPQGGVNLQ